MFNDIVNGIVRENSIFEKIVYVIKSFFYVIKSFFSVLVFSWLNFLFVFGNKCFLDLDDVLDLSDDFYVEIVVYKFF